MSTTFYKSILKSQWLNNLNALLNIKREGKVAKYPRLCMCFRGITSSEVFKVFTDRVRKKYGRVTKMMSPRKLQNISVPLQSMNFNVTRKDIKYEFYVNAYKPKKDIEKSLRELKILSKKGGNISKIDRAIEELTDLIKRGVKEKHEIRIQSSGNVRDNLTEKQIKAGDFIRDLSKTHDAIVNMIGKQKIKFIGLVCNDFAFDSKGYELIGDVRLPMRFHLTKEISEIVGDPQIKELTFNFDKSKLGIKDIELKKIKDYYIVSSRIEYTTSNLLGLVRRNYDQSYNIARMFMVKK